MDHTPDYTPCCTFIVQLRPRLHPLLRTSGSDPEGSGGEELEGAFRRRGEKGEDSEGEDLEGEVNL
eukprot:5251521-Pyramimonas_sp.AAC.1